MLVNILLFTNTTNTVCLIMSKSKGKTGSVGNVETCAACNKVPGENWLSCEICDKWYHAKCVNIKDEAYRLCRK